MLSVILACGDPYETADLYAERLGWRLVFATPRDSGDPLAFNAVIDGYRFLVVQQAEGDM